MAPAHPPWSPRRGRGVHEAIGGEELVEHGDHLTLDPCLVVAGDLDVSLGTDAAADDADRPFGEAQAQRTR